MKKLITFLLLLLVIGCNTSPTSTTDAPKTVQILMRYNPTKITNIMQYSSVMEIKQDGNLIDLMYGDDRYDTVMVADMPVTCEWFSNYNPRDTTFLPIEGEKYSFPF